MPADRSSDAPRIPRSLPGGLVQFDDGFPNPYLRRMAWPASDVMKLTNADAMSGVAALFQRGNGVLSDHVELFEGWRLS